jgi:two-component system alkaline phosphatase synthesis response regulator PhoP
LGTVVLSVCASYHDVRDGKFMKRILVVEDDPHLVELLEYNFFKEGFQVAACCDGANGLARMRESTLDLLVLDLALPSLSGLEICKQVRFNLGLNRLPILILTGKSEEADRIIGLELGADAYVTKPFELRELIARVRTLLWRTDPDFAAQKVIDVGGVRIDPASYCVTRGTKVVPTSTIEFRLLHFLVKHPNRVFTRGELVEAVWGVEQELSHQSVDTYVWRLRQKLEENPQDPAFITTVRGTGYMFQFLD